MCRISVVIPTYRRDGVLRASMRALQGQTLPATDYEIVVVDNACSDTTQALVAEQSRAGKQIVYVREARLGLREARHAGARQARGEIVAYTDDDAVCDPEWLAALLPNFDDPRVGAAGGPIAVQFPEEAPLWLRRFADCYAHLDLGSARRDLQWPDGLYGPNFAIRKQALRDGGGFDPDQAEERWFGPGETGLIRKLMRRGWKVRYEPAARVTHVITPDRANAQFVIERLRKQAACAAYLHCDGNPSRFRLGVRVLKYGAAFAVFRAGAFVAGFGFPIENRVRLASWAAYARAHAAWDTRLMKPGPAREAITRSEWFD